MYVCSVDRYCVCGNLTRGGCRVVLRKWVLYSNVAVSYTHLAAILCCGGWSEWLGIMMLVEVGFLYIAYCMWLLYLVMVMSK